MADPLKTEGCTGNAVEAPGIPCETHNLCVLGIDERIWRITQEMTKNVSGRVTAMSPMDKERIDSYYVALLAYINTAGDDMQDFHYLARFSLTDLMAIQMPVENEAINAALQYLLAADMNLRASQSGRLNDGLLETEKQDLINAINKSKTLIDDAYQNNNPMDMPQSNPRRDIVTPTRN